MKVTPYEFRLTKVGNIVYRRYGYEGWTPVTKTYDNFVTRIEKLRIFDEKHGVENRRLVFHYPEEWHNYIEKSFKRLTELGVEIYKILNNKIKKVIDWNRVAQELSNSSSESDETITEDQLYDLEKIKLLYGTVNIILIKKLKKTDKNGYMYYINGKGLRADEISTFMYQLVDIYNKYLKKEEVIFVVMFPSDENSFYFIENNIKLFFTDKNRLYIKIDTYENKQGVVYLNVDFFQASKKDINLNIALYNFSGTETKLDVYDISQKDFYKKLEMLINNYVLIMVSTIACTTRLKEKQKLKQYTETKNIPFRDRDKIEYNRNGYPPHESFFDKMIKFVKWGIIGVSIGIGGKIIYNVTKKGKKKK